VHVRWSRIAAEEARHARRVYAAEQDGLGARFVQELQTAISRIEAFPLAWPVVESPIRRAVVNRFPYLIHYTIEGDTLTILGVYHASRAPIRWRDRLT